MSLQDSTMLVTLNIKGWSANKKDKKATAEVHSNHNATDAGIFRKHLIDPKALKNVVAAASEARSSHYANTLPWGDNGYRILTSAGYDHYARQMRILKEAYMFQVDNFLRDYPNQIENAKTNLNGLFDISEYPEIDVLRAKFSLKTQIMPLPDANDFRITLAQEDLDVIKKDLTKQIQETMLNAQRDLWIRLHDAVIRVHETLKDPKRRWVKSTFEKFTDLADTIQRLNFSEDAELEALAQKAKTEFAGLDLAYCKKNRLARIAATNEADALLAKAKLFI